MTASLREKSMKGMEQARQIKSEKKSGDVHGWEEGDYAYVRPEPPAKPAPPPTQPQPRMRAAHCTLRGVQFTSVQTI